MSGLSPALRRTLACGLAIAAAAVLLPSTASAAPSDTVMTWNTTFVNGGSGSTVIRLPIEEGCGMMPFYVNWGDSSPTVTVDAWNDPDATHTYATGDNSPSR